MLSPKDNILFESKKDILEEKSNISNLVEEDDFTVYLNSNNIPNNIKDVFIKLNGKIVNLEDDIKKLEENQRLLWLYFSLVSNSQDLFKSIPFYLYKYMGLSDDTENYQKLSRIIGFLKKFKINFQFKMKYF